MHEYRLMASGADEGLKDGKRHQTNICKWKEEIFIIMKD